MESNSGVILRSRLESAADALADSYCARGLLPHLQLLISLNGDTLIDQCYGLARSDGSALAANAIYRIASMSKPIMAAAFLTLVEKGQVTLDTPVSAILPEFAQVRLWTGEMGDDGAPVTAPCDMPITVYDLLRHTAGLSYSFHGQTPIDTMYAERYLDTFHQRRTSAEYAAALAGVPLLFTPGQRFHYSASIDLLGLVAEKIAGEPLDRFIAHTIFEPLTMTDTGFVVTEDNNARLTDAWMIDGANPPTLYDRGEQTRWRLPQKCWSAGGGLVSTAYDYHRFLLMLLYGGELEGRRILSPESVEMMMQNHLPAGGDLELEGSVPLSETSLPGIGMGLGGAVIIDPARAHAPGSVGTYFWGGILSTGFFLDRTRGLIGIVMTQLMPSGATALREDFRRVVYGALEQ